MSDNPHDASDFQQSIWIDKVLPKPLRPYARLARMDRPIGTWLLVLPCWWGAALAADGWPDWYLFALFLVGSFVMRGAGCTINDLVDREYDGKVARTAARPIANGDISVPQAIAFLIAQLLIGLAVLVQLNTYTILLAVSSLALVVLYPFAKRVTYWPQLVLGLTFNWGTLVGWSAVTGSLEPLPILVYAACVFWTLGYDTIYAHQDKADDIEIGVKSSAIRLGDKTKPALWTFYSITIIFLYMAGSAAELGFGYTLGLAVGAFHFARQIGKVDIDDPQTCLAVFKSNRDFGFIVLISIVVGQVWAWSP